MTAEIRHGDALAILREMPDNSVDAVITDPPYGLSNTAPDKVADAITRWATGDREYTPTGKGFMGNAWDAFVPPPAVWDECLRVLKPGGHMAVFAGTRTMDLMTLGVRLAGFDIRDSIAWIYGSGFPKSMDVSKAIDKTANAEREVIGQKRSGDIRGLVGYGHPEADKHKSITAPATDAAKQWAGWGTALKPAIEPVIIARKPFPGTVAANVQEWGTGAINVDATRIGTDDTRRTHRGTTKAWEGGAFSGEYGTGSPGGRFPANVILDENAAAELDRQSGITASKAANRGRVNLGQYAGTLGKAAPTEGTDGIRGHNDTGGASRFFYVAKAPKKERPNVDGVQHPTVKPLTLMRYLTALICPPGGTVLDPFTGSGTTLEAAELEGVHSIGIEANGDYLPLIAARLERAKGAA